MLYHDDTFCKQRLMEREHSLIHTMYRSVLNTSELVSRFLFQRYG